MKRAFTLIELLIVVAIIAILAAIAVPNFLEAQLRSKVARVKSDMRSIAMAIESYSVDNNGRAPILRGYKNYTRDPYCLARGAIVQALDLTTPIAYMTTTMIRDPFVKTERYDDWMDILGGDVAVSVTVCYVNVPLTWITALARPASTMGNRPKYFLVSLGPDYRKGPNPYQYGVMWDLTSYAGRYPDIDPRNGNTYDPLNYDPTNGSISGGDITRH